jgi:4-hydroxy-tetrahydrodipicolinate reductase
MAIQISVLGAKGKMGTRVLALAAEDLGVKVVCAYSREGENLLDAFLKCDVAIDFTSPLATQDILAAALQTKKPLVIGTTGHSLEEKQAIEEASKTIPILYSANFSLGIALCLEAAAQLASALRPDCTIDIIETHHAHKKDAPSGTAIALANAAGAGRLAISSFREGEVIGEHTLIFSWGEEKIELKHTALSRDACAAGALRCANVLAGRGPGLYTFKDTFKDTFKNAIV